MEMKIENTMKYHYVLNRMAKIKKTLWYRGLTSKATKQHSYTAHGSVNRYNHLGKEFVKTTKLEFMHTL